MSPIGPERRLLRDSNMSGIAGEAEVRGLRPNETVVVNFE